MNMKGEFPLDARVSARVRTSTKNLLKKLKESGHTESDVIEYAAKQLAKEPQLLDWEIGELDLEIANHESALFELKAKKQAKLNRLKIIAPKMIDDDTMENLIKSSAKDYAKTLYDSRDEFDISLLDKKVAKKSIMSTGSEWGYDPLRFLDAVREEVKILCQTGMSDS